MSAPDLSSLRAKRKWSNPAFVFSVGGIGACALLLPLFILIFLGVNGWKVISPEFLTGQPRGFPLGSAGGIAPAILGSLALTGAALLCALPLGLMSALYLSEYNFRPRLGEVFRFAVENLAAVPAIVYGMFGYAVAVVGFGWRLSLLSGAFTLALLMTPVIVIGAHEALRAVDASYREAALSLGVSRAYWIRRVLLRKAWPGIIAAAVLAAGHAAGSAAPILLTASTVLSRSNLSWQHPVMTLPTHLYNLVSEAISFEHAYGVAFVLVAGTFVANLCAALLKHVLTIR